MRPAADLAALSATRSGLPFAGAAAFLASFLAGVAYLDGAHSAVLARGCHTRATLAAYCREGKRLRAEWKSDSGFTTMNNPFDTAGGAAKGATLTTPRSPARASTR